MWKQLKDQGADVTVLESDRPEHAYVWTRRAWQDAVWNDRDDVEREWPTVLLNDDVILHPDFRRICDAIVEALPDELISLHANMPAAIDAARAGHHWVRAYSYSGPAVIIPPEVAQELLDYWDALPWEFAVRVNEDPVAILWAWSKQHPMWCAIPAPCSHDTLTSSTLGYDEHAFRTPTVPWYTHTPDGADLTDPAYWKPTGDEPTVELTWMPVSKMETIRRVLAEGHHLCAACICKPATTGTNGLWLCKDCLLSHVATIFGAVR